MVLCHGFPELWFSWRHQIPALATAGFRMIAPDQRGYGESDASPEIEDYGLQDLLGDLLELLEALALPRAIFIGHDWGSFVV
ncbi:MAG: alpha/beta fold hydrolase [SAR324 cluster bacterium]|nr:alpha/beta fold hydrolase [SAR324 cluster bacterium]